MRIMMLVIHFPLDIEQIQGGVHSAVSNLLKGLSNFNIQVRMISFNKEISEERHVQYSENIDIIYCPEGTYPLHSLNYLLKCSFKVKKHIRKFNPDLIHYEAGDAFLFTKLFGLKNKKYLQTIHGIAIAEGKINRKLKVKMSSYFNGLVEKIMFPKNIIHLSNYSQEIYKDKKIEHYAIIPNAVVDAYFNLPVKTATDNRLLYMGVIDRNKNIMFLLHCLKAVVDRKKPYHVDVLGGFKDEVFKDEVFKFIKDNGLAPYVHFHGWVPQSAVVPIVGAADMLVVSSKQESLPMVIAECMSAGKVVIASRVGGIPEMINHGVNGYLMDINQPETLIEVLDDLYNNQSKVKVLSEKAKADAVNKYHCKSVAERTIAFYKEVSK